MNLSFSNETFQYEAGRVIYSLFTASIIPFIILIVQRLIGKRNYRDAYLRRRIFAYVILIDFLLLMHIQKFLYLLLVLIFLQLY